VGSELRQQAVLDGIVRRASGIDAIEGIIVLGSFAGGQPDDLSDLDLVAVAALGRLEEAWQARHVAAGDVLVMRPSRSSRSATSTWLH
jgi:predicted nucleotidyltransferase